MDDNRTVALNELLTLSEPLGSIAQKLGDYPWDSDKELVFLSRAHFAVILSRYLAGELTAQVVEDWANMIEGRDDIGFVSSERNEVKQLLNVLANPILEGPLTHERAIKMLAQLSN